VEEGGVSPFISRGAEKIEGEICDDSISQGSACATKALIAPMTSAMAQGMMTRLS
jgi:hypothetical protein